jgi:hypothetical protein
MRHLVMTAIAVTAIAVSAPIWAQPAPSTAFIEVSSSD